MDEIEPQRTRYTLPRFGAGAWWTVEDVAISGGESLYYRLSPSDARPGKVRDDRGRSALEAFASLPMEAMAERLGDYQLELRRDPRAEWDGRYALELVRELVAFIRTFGPIGIGWGGEFGVQNGEADRLRREREEAIYLGFGIDPASVPWIEPESFWTVSFWGHGPGRGALPRVERRLWHPDQAWSERVRLDDDGLPHDSLPQLVEEHRDFKSTLELVDAIARGHQFDCRRALLKFYHEDSDFWVGPRRPMRLDYGRAWKGLRPGSGHLKLFQLREHQVDWVVLGKCLVADLITRQIDFAMPLVDLSDDEAFEVRWRATSVLEVIYLELLEHVRHRSSFGVAPCEDCGGPILRTRHLGGTGNHWHSGCRKGGRVRRWRRNHAGRSHAR
jgi:hypothetical protein